MIRIRAVAVALIACIVGESALLAVDSRAAVYFGGTASQFTTATAPIDGILDLRSPRELVFWPDLKPFSAAPFAIPYSTIRELEYGQNAGRRVGAAIATSLLLTPLGLLALMSKKRNHFLTVAYRDDSGSDQVAIFELGKDIVRATLAILQTRSGKRMQYQDDEARKFGGPIPGASASVDSAVLNQQGKTAAALQSEIVNESEGMTNVDIVRLRQAGVADDVIVVAIRSAKIKRFDLQPSALLVLTQSGVSNVVLREMQGTADGEPVARDFERKAPERRPVVCVIFWCR